MADNKKKNEQPQEKKMTKYDIKVQRRKEQEARNKRNALIGKCVGIAIAVLIVVIVGVGIYSDYAKKHGEYLKVGNNSIKREEYDFYYGFCRNNTLNSYGSLLQYMGVDTSRDIDSQAYRDGLTWGDFFAEQAANTIRSTYALNAKAAEEGFTYDTTADVQELVDGLTGAAADAQTNVDAYVKMMYGDYATMDKIKNYYADYILSNKYQAKVSDGLEITDDDVNAYYADHAEDYDLVDYRIFAMEADVPEEIENDEEETEAELTEEEQAAQEAEKAEVKEEAMNDAKAKADAFVANVTSEESFINECLKYDENSDDASTLKEAVKKSSIYMDGVAAWLYEDGRTSGDVTVIDDEDGYQIVYFKDRYKDEEATANLRQIIVSAKDTVEDTEDTEAIAAASLAKAEDILGQWEAGEKTEDSFAALADGNSLDSAVGGLKEGAAKSSYTDEINAWLFDSSRKEGDTTVIPYENYAYVFYYISEGLPKWQADIRSQVRSDRMDEYLKEIEEAYPIKDKRANLVFLKQEAETEAETAAETESAAE